jgi:hypothetical protein
MGTRMKLIRLLFTDFYLNTDSADWTVIRRLFLVSKYFSFELWHFAEVN